MSNAAFTLEQREYLDQMFSVNRIATKIRTHLKDQFTQDKTEIYLLQLFRHANETEKLNVILELEKHVQL